MFLLLLLGYYFLHSDGIQSIRSSASVLSGESAEIVATSKAGRGTSRLVSETISYGLRQIASGGGVIGIPGAKDCLGLSKSMCKPCPAPEQNLCAQVEQECDDLFCSPLCLKMAWNCTITLDSSPENKAFAGAVSNKEKKALCSQLIAHACADVLKCCKKAVELTDWAEAATYSNAFPFPLLPIAPCIHDPFDTTAASAACMKCKGVIDVVFQPTPGMCSAFSTGALPYGGAPKPGMPLSTTAVVPDNAGGSMKSLEERCLELSKAISLKVIELASSVKSMLCTCAGCCDPPVGTPDATCYFPVTRRVV